MYLESHGAIANVKGSGKLNMFIIHTEYPIRVVFMMVKSYVLHGLLCMWYILSVSCFGVVAILVTQMHANDQC